MSDQAAANQSTEEGVDESLAAIAGVALPPVVAVGAMVAGYVQGPPMAILVLAAGALVGTVAFFWSSLRAMFGETPLTGADAFAMGAPSAEEEQKRAVLQALKDIEFEHSIGKISDEDYRILNARYRAQAKGLLRLLDNRAAPARKQAESIAKTFLIQRGVVKNDDPAWAEQAGTVQEMVDGTPPAATTASARSKNPYIDESLHDDKGPDDDAADDTDDDAADENEDVDAADENEDVDSTDEVASRSCGDCGTVNDGDALFCKKCGGRFESEMIA